MNSPHDAPPPHLPNTAYWTVASLGAILLVAILLRSHALDRWAFELDEYWNAELTTGRGTVHETLPVNRVLVAPPATSLQNAPPWYRVPEGMQNITHPPGFSIALRFWRGLFGDGDVAARSFGVVFSALAIIPLYLTFGLLSGRSAGLWGSVIYGAGAVPLMVAQQVRPYNLLMPLLLLTIWQAMRLRTRSASWLAAAALGLSCLACVFTHYFAAPVLLAACGFAAVRWSRQTRVRCAVAIGVAALVFLSLWGPTLLKQRQMMRESADVWMKDTSPHPATATLARLCETPLRLLMTPTGSSRALMPAGAMLIVLAGLLAYRRADIRFWLLVLAATLGFIAALDLLNGTRMLDPFLIRYSLPAAPAVIGIIVSISADRRGWSAHALPAAALLGCLLTLPAVYERGASQDDHRPFAAMLDASVREQDIAVFVRRPDWAWNAGFLYATWSHYSTHPGKPGRKIVLLEGIASPDLLDELRRARAVWIVSWQFPDGGLSLLPGAVPASGRSFLNIADVVEARFTPPATQPTQ